MEHRPDIKAFFDARAAQWDATCTHDPHKIAALVTLAGAVAGKRILDIACGTGVLTTELLSREPREVLGVDLSDEMIRLAREKFCDDRIRFVAGDFLELPASDFDVAIIYSAYPHFLDKPALAAKVYDALAPGGRFLVAHSESRETINGRHSGGARQISTELRSVEEEKAPWEALFLIDAAADRPDLYFFSGVKK